MSDLRPFSIADDESCNLFDRPLQDPHDLSALVEDGLIALDSSTLPHRVSIIAEENTLAPLHSDPTTMEPRYDLRKLRMVDDKDVNLDPDLDQADPDLDGGSGPGIKPLVSR